MVNLYNDRIEICKKCELFNKITTQCKECGCLMSIKALIKSSNCPKNKWNSRIRNMAYFAELDFNNVVTQVVVLNDNVVGDSTFPESEHLGVEFLKSLYGQHTVWKQTSLTGEFRKYFATLGGIYNPAIDIFLARKPHNSWIFNPGTYQWEPPIQFPEDGNSYDWDEINLKWIKTDSKV